MTSRPTRPAIRATRRGLLAGGVSLLALALAGCFDKRSDDATVTAALQDAVESVPEYLDGTVKFQDAAAQGTGITAVLSLDTTTREETEQALRGVLERVIRAYVDEPNTRQAYVRIEAHPQSDSSLRVLSADVVTPESGANVTTDDLKREFGV